MSRFAAPIAEQIWDMKYRLKEADGTPSTARSRIPGGGSRGRWRRSRRAGGWEDKFYRALEDFKFLPAGGSRRARAPARSVTLFNCFVMGTIPDSMGGFSTC